MMDLAIRYGWMLIATVVITVCSLLVLINRRFFNRIYRYNHSFLNLFGLEPDHVPWVRYLASWLLGTCMATVVLTLVVNVSETVLLLTGLSGIAPDPVFIPLAIGGIIISLLLIVAAFVPVLIMPISASSAFGIVTFLHIYGFYAPPGLSSGVAILLSFVSTFLYFAALAIGCVGIFLSLYLLIRYYVGTRLFHYMRDSTTSKDVTQNEYGPR